MGTGMAPKIQPDVKRDQQKFQMTKFVLKYFLYIPISVLINHLKIAFLKAHFDILKSYEHMLISEPYLMAYLFVRN